MLNIREKCEIYVKMCILSVHISCTKWFLFHACVALYLHFVLNIGNKMVSENGGYFSCSMFNALKASLTLTNLTVYSHL